MLEWMGDPLQVHPAPGESLDEVFETYIEGKRVCPCRICLAIFSGRGAAWLARLLGVQEVPGSNPGGPTS